MGKKKKKYCKAIQPFTLRDRFYEVGAGLYLTEREVGILIDKNLIKK